MKHYFRKIAALAVSVMCGTLVPALKADEWDRKTNIKIDQSIDVQGTVLPPGSYAMKLLGSPANRTTVLIFNADENHLIATILAIPAYRLEPTGDTQFTFREVAPGQPHALRTWFYPGDNFGFEFASGRGDGAAQSAQRHITAITSNAGSE